MSPLYGTVPPQWHIIRRKSSPSSRILSSPVTRFMSFSNTTHPWRLTNTAKGFELAEGNKSGNFRKHNRHISQRPRHSLRRLHEIEINVTFYVVRNVTQNVMGNYVHANDWCGSEQRFAIKS